jgi:hypothetical protein
LRILADVAAILAPPSLCLEQSRRGQEFYERSTSVHLCPVPSDERGGRRRPICSTSIAGELADRALDDVLVAVSHHSAVIGRLHEISTK